MARDDLARVVLDDVLEIEDRLVDPRAAVDHVALAVANRDPVVAGAALGDVAALVGEDRVVPGAAVLAVVARATGHEVVAVAARDRVVAEAAEQAVLADEVADLVEIAADGVVAPVAADHV